MPSDPDNSDKISVNKPDSPPSNSAAAVEPGPISDSELVLRGQRGDTAAFEELVSRYRGKVYGLAYGMVRNDQDAQDLCQETFIRAWQSLEAFRGQSSFYTWLYRIVHNLTIDMVRRRSRATMVEFDERIGREETGGEPVALIHKLPSDDAHNKDVREAIDRALEQLSPEHREVILLKDFEGLEYKEIAKVVGCSAGTVMSRLFYGRRHLQRLLKEVL